MMDRDMEFDEPEVQMHTFTIRVAMTVEMDVDAPIDADDTALADIAQEYLESDSAVQEVTIHGEVDILRESD